MRLFVFTLHVTLHFTLSTFLCMSRCISCCLRCPIFVLSWAFISQTPALPHVFAHFGNSLRFSCFWMILASTPHGIKPWLNQYAGTAQWYDINGIPVGQWHDAAEMPMRYRWNADISATDEKPMRHRWYTDEVPMRYWIQLPPMIYVWDTDEAPTIPMTH